MTIIEKGKEYASKYWDKDDEDTIRSEGMGDMYCHYYNSYHEGAKDAKEEFLKLIEECEGDIDFLKFKLKNEEKSSKEK